MHLLKTLLVLSLCPVYVATEEVCAGETFKKPSCSAGETVFIDRANYGRMQSNRCINFTENETNCSLDVRREIQLHVGALHHIEFKPFELLRSFSPPCLQGRQPFLDISYQCTKAISNEICVQETFNASCPTGTVINIQSALYGRMRRSRCIDFDDKNLSCYADVQPYLGRLCNRKVQCSIIANNDDSFKSAESSCLKSLKPYLEVFYTCVHRFDCPQLSLPEGAIKQITSDGYDVVCDNETSQFKLQCRDRKWNPNPENLCRTKDLSLLLIFSCAAGVFLLTAIIAVIVCLKRIQKKLLTGTRRQTGVGEVYVYEAANQVRPQNVGCASEYEYEYEYEYEDDCGDDYRVKRDDGTYGDYSHVRDTGP